MKEHWYIFSANGLLIPLKLSYKNFNERKVFIMSKLTIKFKRNLMKKAVVLSIAGVLLCSQSLTAAAAVNASATSQSTHKCAYSVIKDNSATRLSIGHHQYYEGNKTLPDGSTEAVYKECLTFTNHFKGTWTCACERTAGEYRWAETKHSLCGQPDETYEE